MQRYQKTWKIWVLNWEDSSKRNKNLRILGIHGKAENKWAKNRSSQRAGMKQSQECVEGTSLVAQWLRIRLPMQGTRVWALVREDPTCRGATKPVCHNYWACCTLELASHNYWARVPQLLKPTCLEPVLCNKRSHRNEKPAHLNKG